MTRLFNAFPLQFFVIAAATIVLYIISPWLAPGSVSGSSILTVLSFASILVIAAAGQTLVIQQGGLDLSVPGVISLAAVLVTKYPAGADSVLIPWVGAALASGVVSGIVCGVAITRFSVTPLVATLAVNALLYGTVLYLTKGTSTEAVPSMLNSFAAGRIGSVPNLAIFALVLIVLIEIVIRATVQGRRFVAVGVSARTARAAGIRVVPYKIGTYAIAGGFYALSGILLAGYLGVPSLFVGNNYLLPTITVVVLGGTSLLGGAGTIAGTAVGAIFLVQLQQVTIGMGAPTSAQFIIQAAIILVGMAIVAPSRLSLDYLRRARTRGGLLRAGGKSS
jgi:ribose transport system permease protein